MTSRSVTSVTKTNKTATLAQPSPGRTLITSFVCCLHLLDLDFLEDWPGITVSTFSARSAQQNLQHRIKAVEWSLYRLFDIYDAAETKNKLRPFFPPSSQLQSLNLRAALFRLLSDLKKNGHLSKEVVLRKTMLDECKGDKFEEAMSSFAMLVLRKAKSSKSCPLPALIPEELLTNSMKSQLIPLIIAYRKSIRRNLDHRKQLIERSHSASTKLSEISIQLQERQKSLTVTDDAIESGTRVRIEDRIASSWSGDQAWVKYLTSGGMTSDRNELTKNLGEDLQALNIDLDDDEQPHPEQYSPMLELQEFAQEQARRLETLRSMQKEFRHNSSQPRQTTDEPTAIDAMTTQTETVGFSKHKDLHLLIDTNHIATISPLQPQYQDILSKIEAEVKNLKQRPFAKSGSPSGTSIDHVSEDSDASGLSTEFGTEMIMEVGSYDDQGLPLTADSSVTKDLPFQPKFTSFTDASQDNCGGDHDANESTGTSSLQKVDDMAIPQVLFLHNAEGNVATGAVPVKADLSDRARMSMAGTASALSLTSDTNRLVSPTKNVLTPSLATTVSSTAEIDLHQKQNLASRTRLSMSLASAHSAIYPKRHDLIKAIPKTTFPVNAFEKMKASPSALWDNSSAAESPATVYDMSLDDNADYAAVFKSRPKLRMSPVLRPDDSQLDLDIDTLTPREST